MSVSLDPTVAGKLQQFGRRRFRLLLARGICAGIVSLVLCVALVAAVDWYWLLSDRVRWLLSGLAYLTVFGVVWFTCLRRLIRSPATEEIAAQVEQCEPQLRENLLSAVELAADDPAAVHDSPVFRSLLQGNVARMMSQVRVPRLLPVRIVGRWIVAAGVLAAVAALLLTSEDPRFRQLTTRAMLPGANVARVSRIQVEVLQPTPHSLILAEDETVAVVVEVTGGSVDQVILETTTATQGVVRQTMRGRSDVEFAANIHVADEAIDYRILAGDAITQRFRIESRARPRVTAFHKTFEYPEYSQLPEQTITEAHGDLLVLEGTTAELALELDQEVSEAELRISPTGSEELILVPLTPAAPQDGRTSVTYTARVPVSEPAIYKVHLVSKETGFDNLFSPKYEIRPQPDLIPKAGFVDQQESTLLLPPNDILALKAMAEDDLPLVSLEQQVSVNGRDWEVLPLSAEPTDAGDGRQMAAAWHWDLLTHRLKVGDRITTRLVATDRRGNRGESIPLQVIVAAQDFDPKRHAVMERKAGLYDQLSDFAALLQEHRTSALEVIERLRQSEGTADAAVLDHTLLLDLATRQRDQAAKILDSVKQVAAEMPPGADALDLELTGRVIARLHREYTSIPSYLLTAIRQSQDEKTIQRDLDELKRTFERTADDAKNLAGHYQHLMSHNFLAALALDLDALQTQQKLVVDSPTQTWDRLQRQETLVLNQLRVLEQLIHAQRSRMPSHLDGHLRNLLTWAETHRTRLQEGLESEDRLAQLQKASRQLFVELEQKQRMDVVDGGLPGRLVGARRDFYNRAGTLYPPIYETARAVEQENRLAAQASESDDSAKGSELLKQAERFVAEIDQKHRRSVGQLRVRRELTQVRPDSDAQYAADAGLTYRAVTALLNQHRRGAPQESIVPTGLLEVAPAYRTLEAGHQLAVVHEALRVLLHLERWNSQTIQARIDHPRQWDVVNDGFEQAGRRLREAGVDNEIIAALDQIRHSAAVREVGRRITQRRHERTAMYGAGHELAEIRGQLMLIVQQLAPVMAEARAVVAKYAPTIPEMAQQAADQLRTLEEQTTQLADDTEQNQNSEPTEPSAPMAELNQQQQQINQQLEELYEALVDDANQQDLLDNQQRERARDADDSIALIQEPAVQMNQALHQAEQASSARRQAQQLAQAAEQQEKTADALELVARHFERLDDRQDVADSRAELRQMERDQGIARQLDQQFQKSEQLATMAAADPQQLMAELEAELQRNPAMREALSEITQDTLQEARNALDLAAQEDRDLQQSNERSDAPFQMKKRELAADLRQMATDASHLSRTLVAQAAQMSGQGKTPEAQQQLTETQQTLNDAAAQAGRVNENQRLGELAATAQETSQALQQAAESLKQARQKTAAGKDEKIHADDKSKAAARKDAERRRQQFHDQEKRHAADLARRADQTKRQADQGVRNAENQVRNMQRQVQQAENNLKRRPDDKGLQRNLEQLRARKEAEEAKVAAAKEVQKNAQELAKEMHRKSDEVKRRVRPNLDAENPATQLADQYAEEAVREVDELNRRAEQLAATTDFGKELTPSQNQLAAAAQQQSEIVTDVVQAAEDVARAARHERRLNNMPVVEPLQDMADRIQQVARNEVTGAESQLQTAAAEAKQASADGIDQQAQPNAEALQAQQALATAEQALAEQAGQLSGILEPMLAAAEAAATAENNTAASDSAAEQRQPAADTAAGEGEPSEGSPGGPASQAAAASPPGSNSSPGTNGASAPAASNPESAAAPAAAQTAAAGRPAPLTPEERAEGQQLAQTLDELDRLQAAPADPSSPPQPGASQPATPATPATLDTLDTLAAQARAQQAALAAARSQAQQQASMALSEGGAESTVVPAATGVQPDFSVVDVNRQENSDWGRLRSKSAEDLSRGRAEAVSEEYRKSVDAYFRVLAERARRR
ncbi:MAG: hypothetical protein RIK87_09525 [Fuerstiella sp.]